MDDRCTTCCKHLTEQRSDIRRIHNTLEHAVTNHVEPPFSKHLDIVSFVAVITLSFSLSASQGFAMTAVWFGTALGIAAPGQETQRAHALDQTRHAATLLAWSAASSAFSLMVTLAIRILQPVECFVRIRLGMDGEERRWWMKFPALIVAPCTWLALGLQVICFMLIGEALKAISPGSGWMIQMKKICDAHCKSASDAATDVHAMRHELATAVAKHTEPSFSKYLDLVSFVAVITLSFSLSASQGFATSGTLFGIALNAQATDSETKRAVVQVTHAATLLAWAAATSGFSLMISLALRIMQTSDPFVKQSMDKDKAWSQNPPRLVLGPGCFVALGLQAASMALIGEALKVTSEGSGWMLQGCLAGTAVVAVFVWRKALKHRNDTAPLVNGTSL